MSDIVFDSERVKAMNALIVTGGGWHPFDKTSSTLANWLKIRRNAESKIVESTVGITTENLQWADVIIINHQGAQELLTEEQGNALEDFVCKGGGLVGIHSAADSFRENQTYMNLIGCEFVTHGPKAEVRININEPKHQITAHTNSGFTTFDEIYQCKIHGNPKILASVKWEGKSFPMITINEFDKGRVFYFALGHDEIAWSNEDFQTLLIRGIDWAYKGNIGKTIGCGLLGVGPRYNMGQHHAGQISRAFGLEIVAACDLREENINRFKKDYPQVTGYTNLNEFLSDSKLDLVTIIVPHNVHFELGKKCLQAGKHVIIEKPFVLTCEQASELIELAEKNNVMLSVYQNRRWDWEYLRVKHIVDSSEIGNVYYMRINMANYHMPGDEWRSYKEISGGLLYDWGAHHFDWILNIIDSPMQAVFAATHNVRWHWCTNEDNANVMIKFENGAIAEYHTSTVFAGEWDSYVLVAGSEGTIKINRMTNELHVIKYNTEGQKIAEQIVPGIEHGKYWYHYYQNIANYLLFSEPLAVRPEQSRRVIALIEAAYESAQTNQAISPKFK